MKRMQGKDAEKLLSQWEKVAKCNFKSKAQVHEIVSFSWNEMLLQCRRQISCLELFLRAREHRICLELRTLCCV